MRRLCLIALLCVSMAGFSQSTDYDTTFTVYSGTSGAWKAKVHLPSNYYISTDSFQCILFFLGAGEACATSYTPFTSYGPHAYLAAGWNGGVTLGNGTHYPIIISISQCSAYDINALSSGLFTTILNRYRIKRRSLHLSGWSAGAHLAKINATEDAYDGTAPYGPFTYADKFKSIIDVQGVIPDDNADWYIKVKNFARNKWGGKYLALWGTADGDRGIIRFGDSMNAAVPGSATVIQTSDGHNTTAVNRFFGNSGVSPQAFTINGISQTAYQWALRNGDTSLAGSGNVNPVVNAGSDQTITLPTSSVTLSGSATDADGTISSYAWTKISGGTATITSASFASTSVTGLVAGVYVFRLTATDNSSGTAYDDVQVTVNAACTAPIANAGSDQTILRSKGFTRLNGSATTGATSYIWRRITAVSNESYGNLITPIAAISDVMILPYTDTKYYDFELTATNACGTAKDTVRVNISWGTPPPQLTTLRFATSGDADTIPNCNTGDLVIDGANDGYNLGSGVKTDIYIYNPLSGASIGAGKKVLIKAGKYNKIQLVFGANQVVGTSANPVIITPYGGQLECTSLSVKNVINAKITGKYRPDTSGHINYRGHEGGNYAFSHGKYGIYVNNNWESLAGFGLEVSGANTDSVEIEFCEVANGNFSGIHIKENGGTNDYDGFKIHDNYIRNIHGEGMYLGSTGSDPQHQMNGWRIYNNRLWDCGNEIIQFGQQGSDNTTDHNVFVGSATNWKSTFHDSQDFGAQAMMRNGRNKHRDNIHLGSGEQFINFFSISKSGLASNNDTVHYKNNLFLHAKGFIGNYFGGETSPVPGMVIAIDSNYFGRFVFKANEVFSDSRGTNTQTLLQMGENNLRYVIRNNVRDNSKTTWLYGTTNVDSSGNSVATINNPQFVNSGFTDTFHFETLTRWADTLFRTWKDEYPNLPGTRVGDPVVYQSGELVSFLGKIYKSKVSNNHLHMPQGATDAYWELQYWLNGSDTSFVPPNDFRLKAGDAYRNRNMGLLDLYDAPPQNNNGDTINVNLYSGSNPYNNTAWNNWSTPNTEVNTNTTSPLLKWSNGDTSTVTATLNYLAGVADNGTGYGGTMCPPEVLRYANYASTNRTLTLSNLPTGKTYKLELYASRGNTGNATVFEIGTERDTIVTDNNKTIPAVFENLTPNGSNQIVVNLYVRSGSTFQYLNGFRLIGTSSGARQSTTPTKHTITAIGEKAQPGMSVVLSPNPAWHTVRLQYSNVQLGKTVIRVYDVAGKMISTRVADKKATVLQQQLDVQQLPAGLYYVEVTTGNGKAVIKKFIKQ